MAAADARDTIAAIATAAGQGGIGIVRVSGPAVPELAQAFLGALPPPRLATLATFRDGSGEVFDQGLALYFPAPHSFTGEHVLELHGHGGPVVLELLLAAILNHGARRARPGEFSERAFLNGKLDLAQAEAIADLISAGSAAAARAASRSLQGEFSRRVRAIVEKLIRLRVQVEAALDFPEEEIDFLTDPALAAEAQAIESELDRLIADSRQGQLLHDGLTLVLAGRPNAGKSSVLNRLTREDSAIVSSTPGTTRDVLRAHIQIDGLPLHVLDTAGLRATTDDVEGEGVRRARAAIEHADRILLVIDDSQEGEATVRALRAELPPQVPVTLIRNKIDLSRRECGYREQGEWGLPEVAVSAKTETGIEDLRQHLKQAAGYAAIEQGVFSARGRQREALQRARAAVVQARVELAARRGEIGADELRLAQQALGEITGEFTSDDLLGRIFSEFCIGK